MTELTPEQRIAIDQARRLLSPYFSGETLRLYLPRMHGEDREQRDRRILESLQLGKSMTEIAQREDCSRRLVYKVRARMKVCGTFQP
jgi:Mor family transcriptional regulator